MQHELRQSWGAHESVRPDQIRTANVRKCVDRGDDTGFTNFCRSWYLFFVHLLTCSLFVLGVTRLDQEQFEVGSRTSRFEFGSRLYQAEVTAIVTVALVLVRINAASCSALLSWRIIFILLEKKGIALAEITRLLHWRLPPSPSPSPSRTTSIHLGWSVWAATATLLLWPHGLAAPFASSSITWHPDVAVPDSTKNASLLQVGYNADWSALLLSDARLALAIGAAANIAKNPDFAFRADEVGLQSRRYFHCGLNMSDRSVVSLTMPYFTVGLNWIDALDGAGPDGCHLPELSAAGTTILWRNYSIDRVPETPGHPSIFKGSELVAVKVGSVGSEASDCGTGSDNFDDIPKVKQLRVPVKLDQASNTVIQHDCYAVAEATILAGNYAAKNCQVSTPANDTTGSYATCQMMCDDDNLLDSWITGPTLDFLTTVLKFSVLQNFTQPWIDRDLSKYTTGMLTLGYHATWSGLTHWVGNASETVPYQPAKPVMSVLVTRSRLYIWLGMNLTLTAAAVLVFSAQKRSRGKTVRDAAVAALTMDLSDVTHSERAMGLCQAVELSEADKKMPKLMWKRDADIETGLTRATGMWCPKRVVIVKETEER